MKQEIDSGGLHCIVSPNRDSRKICYLLYPADILGGWIEEASERYGATIVVITGMDWDNALTPWPAKGEPPGCPDFKGDAAGFLSTLCDRLIPEIERTLDIPHVSERDLVGVSLSGLFALWQWVRHDYFKSIASMSGPFWYDGFLKWFLEQPLPRKDGMAYFSLGVQEEKSSVKAFRSVGKATHTIVERLEEDGVSTVFESVPGNHYSDPVPRLDKAMTALYGKPLKT